MPSFFLTVLTSVLSTTSVIAVLAFVLGKTFETHLKARYDKRLADYENQQEIARKVEMMADILANWIAYPPGTPIPKEHRVLLNRLIFTSTMWLRAEYVKELNRELSANAGVETILFRLLLLARKELTGDDSLQETDLVLFPYELEISGHPVCREQS